VESVVELAEQIRKRARSARECVDEALARVETHNDALGAFIVVDPDLARGEADRVDAALARGETPGPLAGVPFGVKDADRCAGLALTHGSLLHKGRPVEKHDSIHVARLRAAGAIPIGVTAAPEFGAISWTSSSSAGVSSGERSTSAREIVNQPPIKTNTPNFVRVALRTGGRLRWVKSKNWGAAGGTALRVECGQTRDCLDFKRLERHPHPDATI